MLFSITHRKSRGWIAALLLGGFCGSFIGLAPVINVAPKLPWIAFIPRTSGTVLTESMHSGAEQAAKEAGYDLYWNAASREDDVDRQILLITSATAKGAKGLILGPTSSSALISTVSGLTSEKIPVAIVQTDAMIPKNQYLTMVSPNQVQFGQLAAHRIAMRLGGNGEVAVIGLNTEEPETFARSRAFIDTLANYPRLEIVIRQHGSSQLQEAEQSAGEVLDMFPKLNAIFEARSWLFSNVASLKMSC
jgi:ribose transport system substrate-binding protein